MVRFVNFLLVFSFLFCSCGKSGYQPSPYNPGGGSDNPSGSEDPDFVSVTYKESSENFVNPERGFYQTSETYTSNFDPLDAVFLKNVRKGQKIYGTQYTIASSLLYRSYVFDNFVDKPISEDILDKISNDMDIARSAGVKLILRFNYTIDTHGGCDEGICPPYGDASVDVILQHIGQLKPLLQQNADVIAVVQTGFIGIWGEWYYSDFFGGASHGGKIMDDEWEGRNDVIGALLDAVPDDRMIQVRVPQYKQRFVYGVSAGIASNPITEAQAFDGSDISRIGFHNDALLSNGSEDGTFQDYGSSSSSSNSSENTISTLKQYFKKESQFVVVGGESNSDENPDIFDCKSAGGQAEDELRNMHYSYVNAEYHTDVIGAWNKHGCLATINNKLGYRFVLESATFPKEIKTGEKLQLVINVNNAGFASAYNKRPVQLILKNKQTGDVKALAIDTDIRKWYPGKNKIEQSLTLPAGISAGQYELLLNLPDGYESLSSNPEYSIRLANENVWDEATGYNDLNYTLTVK